MKKRTGLFGGSFNPIHNGHISLAQQLKEQAGLDEVWLMVSPQNPLKQAGDLLDDEQRLLMARLAVEQVEGIVVSDYEMHLPRPSYTWNTLEALKRDYPDRQFVLMIGGDKTGNISTVGIVLRISRPTTKSWSIPGRLAMLDSSTSPAPTSAAESVRVGASAGWCQKP